MTDTPNQEPKKKKSGCMIAAIVIAIIAFLSIGGCMMMGGLFVAGTAVAIDEAVKEENRIPDEIHEIGTTIATGQYEITVSKITQHNSLGNEFYQEKPAEGGIFIGVIWSYKNISNEPINIFNKPSIELISPDLVRYETAVGASTALASSTEGLSEKALSDLNPGITTKTADAFEVSTELLNQSGWTVLIKCDNKIRYKFN